MGVVSPSPVSRGKEHNPSLPSDPFHPKAPLSMPFKKAFLTGSNIRTRFRGVPASEPHSQRPSRWTLGPDLPVTRTDFGVKPPAPPHPPPSRSHPTVLSPPLRPGPKAYEVLSDPDLREAYAQGCLSVRGEKEMSPPAALVPFDFCSGSRNLVNPISSFLSTPAKEVEPRLGDRNLSLSLRFETLCFERGARGIHMRRSPTTYFSSEEGVVGRPERLRARDALRTVVQNQRRHREALSGARSRPLSGADAQPAPPGGGGGEGG